MKIQGQKMTRFYYYALVTVFGLGAVLLASAAYFNFRSENLVGGVGALVAALLALFVSTKIGLALRFKLKAGEGNHGNRRSDPSLRG